MDGVFDFDVVLSVVSFAALGFVSFAFGLPFAAVVLAGFVFTVVTLPRVWSKIGRVANLVRELRP